MKNLLKMVFFSCLFYTNCVNGQDMHFTQFYSSPLYLNPAFAGAGVCSRVSTTYRNQWPGISKTYQSYLLSADHYLVQYNLGIGLLFGNDVAGSGNLKTTSINPLIAYELRVTRKLAVRFGVQPGFGTRSINYNNLLFGDQIVRGGGVSTVEVPKESISYFDIGTGALAYTKKYWVGVSFYHLNRPEQSLTDEGTNKLPIKYSGHGGYKFILNEKEPEESNKKAITAALNYRGQQDFDQLDVGCYYSQYVFSLGLWYRGIPGLKAYKKGYSNNDAIAIIFGVKANRFNVGYSYDYTMSGLTNISHGAHEISLSYELCKLKAKKKRIVISCPKF